MNLVVRELGLGDLDPASPILYGDDEGLLRGDGAFEACLVLNGRVLFLDEHLARLERSAATLDLLLPPIDVIRSFVLDTASAWPSDREGALRLICSRGRAGLQSPTIFATVRAVPDDTASNRRHGLRLCTGSLGYSVGVREASPWLLPGAKSLSYAVNMASHRWATKRGYDEMLWVSTDGFALESPSFSLLWLVDRTLCSVPLRTGIVAGTVAAAVISQASMLSLIAEERLVSRGELVSADAVWLTGSLSGILPVTAVDDLPVPQSPLIHKARELIGYPGD